MRRSVPPRRPLRFAICATLGLALAACSGQAAPSPDQATTPSPAPTDSTPAAPLSLGTDPTTELAPGTYAVPNPAMRFTIAPYDNEDRWFGSRDSREVFLRYGPDPCDGCETGFLVVLRRPDTLQVAVEEWSAVTDATLSAPGPVELGGLTGVRFEGSVSSSPEVSIVYGGYNPIGTVRVYVLDQDGSATVVVVNEMPEGEGFFEVADEVLETFVFEQ